MTCKYTLFHLFSILSLIGVFRWIYNVTKYKLKYQYRLKAIRNLFGMAEVKWMNLKGIQNVFLSSNLDNTNNNHDQNDSSDQNDKKIQILGSENSWISDPNSHYNVNQLKFGRKEDNSDTNRIHIESDFVKEVSSRLHEKISEMEDCSRIGVSLNLNFGSKSNKERNINQDDFSSINLRGETENFKFCSLGNEVVLMKGDQELSSNMSMKERGYSSSHQEREIEKSSKIENYSESNSQSCTEIEEKRLHHVSIHSSFSDPVRRYIRTLNIRMRRGKCPYVEKLNFINEVGRDQIKHFGKSPKNKSSVEDENISTTSEITFQKIRKDPEGTHQFYQFCPNVILENLPQLEKINENFLSRYAAVKDLILKELNKSNPIILIDNDIKLYRNCSDLDNGFELQSLTATTPLYVLSKVIDHIPLHAFAIISEEDVLNSSEINSKKWECIISDINFLLGKLNGWKDHLRSAKESIQNSDHGNNIPSSSRNRSTKSKASMSNRQNQIEKSPFLSKENIEKDWAIIIERNVSILKKTKEFATKYYSSGNKAEVLNAFTSSIQRDIEENITIATQSQLEHLYQVYLDWKSQFPEIIERAHVIIRASHFAVKGNIFHQFFDAVKSQGLMSQHQKVIVSEAITTDELKQVLVTSVIDSKVSKAFFGDEQRMTQDLLSTAAYAYLHSK